MTGGDIRALDGVEDSTQLLILNDGKPGHLNQSLAFAKLLKCDYRVREVRFHNRLCKALSYLLDRFGIYTGLLLGLETPMPQYRMVISAGSETYYANRVLARRGHARSVVVMLPAGYRYDFDLIVAQLHDQPPRRPNLLAIPVNLSAPEPKGLVARHGQARPCVAVVLGGPSRHFSFELERLQGQLEKVFQLFPDGEFWVTTSRRTPAAVEALVERLPFDYRLIFSREQVNPVPDFLALADYVFITEDSTSMISEAVCYGQAHVEILGLAEKSGKNKIAHMIETLAELNCLHRFDGSIADKNHKIDLRQSLADAVPAAWLEEPDINTDPIP